MHADSDAPIRHESLKRRPRHALRREIDQELEHVPAMTGIAARRQQDGGESLELLEVAARQLAPACVESLEAPQLVDADLRRHIAQIAFRAGEHHVDFTFGVALDAVKAVLLEERRRPGIRGRDGSALDAGHVLVGMKTEYHQIAEAADQPASMARADGVGSIFHHPQAPLRRDVVERIDLHGKSGKVDRHDGAGSGRDRGLDEVHIDVAGMQFDIDEYGFGPHPRHHIRARRKTHRRNDHLIARLHAGDLERHLEPGSRRGHDSHVTVRSQICGESRLERLNFRAARELAGAEHVRNGRDARFIDGIRGVEHE